MTGVGSRIKPVATGANLLEFPDRATASAAAAVLVGNSIRARLETEAHCSIVVSGGSTPGPCFDALSRTPLDWSRVTVIPSDERWVPPDHPDSNERLIRDRLLVEQASAAHFLPLFRPGVEAPEAVTLVKQELAALATQTCCALLGMGEDGHFASLFPDFAGLQRALDPDYGEPGLVVETPSSPYQRISLSLAFLLESESTVLLIFGDAKRRVFEAAQAGDRAYPIESLVRRRAGSLTVVWAP